MQHPSQQPISPRGPTSWWSWIFVALTKIPVLGDSLRILNSYTYDGDTESDRHFAPWRFWIKKHWFSVLCVAAMTTISTQPACLIELFAKYCAALTLPAVSQTTSVGALILSIFPNLLGFGIGVYALIFSLSANFIKLLQQQIQKQKVVDAQSRGHALLLNADMAYPLLVIAITIGIGVVQQVYPNTKWLVSLSWMALWYSLLMAFEILFALYGLGEREILNKLK